MRSQSTSLINARIGYAFERRTRLSLDAYNLLDRKNSDIDYFYESRLAGESAPVADVHFHPVERRALRLTLTANFLRPMMGLRKMSRGNDANRRWASRLRRERRLIARAAA